MPETYDSIIIREGAPSFTSFPADPQVSSIAPGLIGFSAGPAAVQIAAVMALAAWVALSLSIPIAGFIRLRGWRPANWLRAAAWAGAWIAGAVLLELARALGNSPGVSWGELAVCAAWLVLGAVMTWILAVPGSHSDMPSTSSRASGKASQRPTGTRDLRA